MRVQIETIGKAVWVYCGDPKDRTVVLFVNDRPVAYRDSTGGYRQDPSYDYNKGVRASVAKFFEHYRGEVKLVDRSDIDKIVQ